MHRSLLLAALLLAASPAHSEERSPGAVLDLEAGAVWASQITAQVPGSTGTRFTIGSGGDFSASTAPFIRARVGATLGRHALFFTFAPLRLSGEGRSSADIFFRNQTFTATGDASVSYRFDTYRLTYRYALVSTRTVDLALGATALLRDAEIRLSQPGQSTAERNTGVVPLVSFRLAWRMGGGPVALSLDGDAIAARQGRAEDVALALEFTSGDLTYRAGYRLVEGGVDTSSVYSFAWLNHVGVGVSYRF